MSKARTMLERTREALAAVCAEYEVFGFAYFDDTPLKFVMRGTNGNTATFEMDDDGVFKAFFDWHDDNIPDYEKVKNAVRDYMIEFALDYVLSLAFKGEPPARAESGRIAEIW